MRKLARAWLLALVLAMLASSGVMAADTALTVKTPATIPKAGETFSVTVEITGNPGLCAVQFTLVYDKDMMTCTKADEGALLDGMLSVTNASAQDGAIIAAASASPSTGDGALGEFTFTAKADLTSYGFKLAEVVLTDANSADIAFTLAGAELIESEPAVTPAPPQTTATPTTPATEQPKPEEKPAGEKPAGQSGSGEKPAEAQTGTAAEQPTGDGEAIATLFGDTAGHWGAEWIAKAVEKGLFYGDDKGNFNPDRNISRGDYVLVLYRMAGEPEVTETASFADVDPNAYYAKAIAWAYGKGYVNGKGSGFDPTGSLTRQEAMKILFAYAGSPTGMEVMLGTTYDSAFADSGEIAGWAKPAMYWAYYHEIIGGMSADTLGPTATATRAQLAKILVGYMEKQ